VTLIGLGLLVSSARMRLLDILLALGGIGLAATSFVFCSSAGTSRSWVSRTMATGLAIVIALAAETAAVLLLVGYLAVCVQR